MSKNTLRYWGLQLAGWGGWTLLNVFFVYLFSQWYFKGDRGRLFLLILLTQFVWYILSTHLLRYVLHKISWLQLPMNKVVIVFISGVILTGCVSYYGSKFTVNMTNISLSNYDRQMALKKAETMEKELNLTGDYYKQLYGPVTDSATYNSAIKIRQNTGWSRDDTGEWQYTAPQFGRFWWDLIFGFVLIALWLAIYMGWHFVQRNQKDKLDKLQLEKTVKELELKTIKSHINPHFIFNSLNSIRALVEENPERARQAITELSNILRSSLQMDKLETISLENELNIVKNYLALEQIRFEERLKVNFDIAEDTLQQPVPPMMLQTLVENAIKHGISKRIEGGTVNIISKYKGANFELLVQNTGKIAGNAQGFGIKSTRDRLHFLHGSQTFFSISNLEPDMVQVRIQMPAN